MARRIILIAVLSLATFATPAMASYLSMREARNIVKDGARRYVSIFNADGFRIEACGRQSTSYVLCKVRIKGYDYGAYSCDVFVGVRAKGDRVSSKLAGSYC